MTGHLLGAAGAVEAMATVLAVQNDIVPPTINHEAGDEDPEIDYNLNFTFNKAQKREVRAGLSNTSLTESSSLSARRRSFFLPFTLSLGSIPTTSSITNRR